MIISLLSSKSKELVSTVKCILIVLQSDILSFSYSQNIFHSKGSEVTRVWKQQLGKPEEGSNWKASVEVGRL